MNAPHPFQPRDDEGPIFKEPWEAQAFSLVIALHEKGIFSWQEWADVLSEEIRLAQSHGDDDLGNTYYQHWLKALEKITITKNLSAKDELIERKRKWHSAYINTPHGKPIELSAADSKP
ncbi:MAG: nitrile hydratase accessory protein [SAR86 cluster bacterium]|uniref:Nitrile hydratase accessory protein n=1 Tax=SAR86 cluster bacterium TaxID=2030880 RepID=A0A2A5B997_9GAMM|nr:MAG: nitrile hydratase accessory protein [SAR86 cluster bacterium]